MNDWDVEPVEDWMPGPELTRPLYLQWRNARRAQRHAEKMNNPVWEWLVRTRISAYTANHHYNGPDSMAVGPAWCCNRFGQSRTLLPDGRTILIAGEHEDYYDPDFYIYNDVIVLHGDGSIDIFGYPESEFPPTDFHSATLVGNRIILIGMLSYAESRRPPCTPVHAIDIDSLRIERLETSGQNPGWIFEHRADLEDGELLIRGGKLFNGTIIENIDDWKLNLETLSWTRLTDRRWVRVEVFRNDREMNHLWQARNILWKTQVRWSDGLADEIAELSKELGATPDLEALKDLYHPPVPHDAIPEQEDEYNVFRLRIEDVVVRYVEDSDSITMTIEGDLPGPIIDQLIIDLRGKLSRIENWECDYRVY